MPLIINNGHQSTLPLAGVQSIELIVVCGTDPFTHMDVTRATGGWTACVQVQIYAAACVHCCYVTFVCFQSPYSSSHLDTLWSWQCAFRWDGSIWFALLTSIDNMLYHRYNLQDENMWFQWIGMIGMILLTGEFAVQFIMRLGESDCFYSLCRCFVRWPSH